MQRKTISIGLYVAGLLLGAGCLNSSDGAVTRGTGPDPKAAARQALGHAPDPSSDIRRLSSPAASAAAAPTPRPHLSAVVPAVASPGTELALAGTGLDAPGGLLVRIGDRFVRSANVSATSAVATVPEGLSPGSTTVQVRTAVGRSNSLGLKIAFEDGRPLVRGLVPKRVPPGATVIVAGDRLCQVAEDACGVVVADGFEPQSLRKLGDQQLSFVVPAGTPRGIYSLAVTSGGLTSNVQYLQVD